MDHWERFERATTEAEIDQLITDGFNPYTKSWVGNSFPIIRACEKDKLIIVQALIKHRVNPNRAYGGCFNLIRPISVAARHGHLKIVEYLISIGCDIADAILLAIAEGRIDVLEFLLSLKRDVNTKLQTPIGLTCGGGGNRTKTRMPHNTTPIELSCWKCDRKAFDLLLEAGALINSGNDTHPLIIVASSLEDRFATQFAEQLVIYGADFNYSDDLVEHTPLYVACLNNKIELVNFLTSLRCEVNTVHYNKCFQTPLILACGHNNTEIVKLLIAAGADTNYVDRFGKQAIDYAESEEVRHLLSP
jgi:ankyrin repeat protein